MFKSLKRVSYPVSDMARARQWYSGILGTQPIFETPSSITFKAGDCWLTLAQDRETRPACMDRIFCFWEVDDTCAAYRNLIEAGAVTHLPVTHVMNIAFARVIDPFGNIIGITHTITDAKEKSVDSQPSQTALMTALCRALAAKDDRLSLRGQDTLAKLFLTDDMKKHLMDGESRKRAIGNVVPPWLYGYLIARTEFFDDCFRKALSKGIPQIVFLGAGYDTRAYRYGDMLQNTGIFELDVESTQKRKRAILRDANIEIPPQVSFATADFKTGNIHDVLINAGFNSMEETLFIWEGVTYYLPPEAVGSTLSFIQKHAPCGSTLCFDYMTDKIDSANPGEPCRFWIMPDEIEPFLAKYGIKVIEHLNSKEMEQRYLALADRSLAERLLPHFRFIHGRLSA